MVHRKRKTSETPKPSGKGSDKTPPKPRKAPDEPTPRDRTPAQRLMGVAADVPAVADRLRLVGLDRARDLGSARERALTREEARRRGRFGATAPEVAEAAVRRARERVRQSGRRAAVRRFETGLGIGREEAVVMGQVRRADGRPAAGAHVAVSDEQGAGRNAWAHATTDGAGFYEARSDFATFRRRFAGAEELTVTVTGHGTDGTHTERRPFGGPQLRVRVVDVDLPATVAPPDRVDPVDPVDPVFQAPVFHATAPLGAARPTARSTTRSATGEPTRVYLAAGARGELVRRVQARLAERGCDPRGIDGDYGPDTATAVTAFQEDVGLPVTGEVDGATWRALFEIDPPDVLERALQVTASFEGHGYTHAAGNWDDAGITWGVIGFTLRHGSLGEVIRRVHEAHPEIVAEDFGPTRSETLLEALELPAAERVAWADSISLTDDKTTLHKPWREAFEAFGARPEVQAAQRAVAEERYAAPARRTAEELGLASELGYALAFDVHVQNGGVKSAAREAIAAARGESEPEDEHALRRLVAHAVAEQARDRYRSDVLARKLTLADGQGRVHGRSYDLRAWGLGEAAWEIG